MKTLIKTLKIYKTLVLVMIFTASFTVANSQGLLNEGAERILESISKNKKVRAAQHSDFIMVKDFGTAEERSNIIRDFFLREKNVEKEYAPVVLKSYKVSKLELGMEEELTTEEWMNESFAEGFEAPVETESWMESSLTESMELTLRTENWMTEDLSTHMEESIVSEDWMSSPLYYSMEEDLEVEPWMNEPVGLSLGEERIETESWMTSSFASTSMEEEVELEAWMTEAFASNEAQVETENWMLTLLY